MRDRKAYFAEWHRKNKERRNAAAKARYHANPKPILTAKAHSRAYMTDAERERVRARDRAYRASRKERDQAYREENRERIAAMRREQYLRAKAQKRKRDPIAAARRLAERAAQRVKRGYAGELNGRSPAKDGI